jgi:hypothetical protein
VTQVHAHVAPRLLRAATGNDACVPRQAPLRSANAAGSAPKRFRVLSDWK